MVKMKILITGCAGLLGSHFSKYLLDNECEVVGIDNLSGGYSDFVDPRIDFYRIDLNDAEALQNVFETHSIDYVFHFAGIGDIVPSINNPYNYLNTNVLGTVNILNLNH